MNKKQKSDDKCGNIQDVKEKQNNAVMEAKDIKPEVRSMMEKSHTSLTDICIS